LKPLNTKSATIADLKYRIRDMMKCFPESGHPMDALQACAAALGLFYSRRALDDPIYIQKAVVRLLAKIPTMVAAFQLIRKGNDPVQPRDDLDYAANFLYMLNEREPDPLAARIFDICLTLHAEHTINASTFSAMVTASTLTDPYAVVASAVGTLAGPLHGGANEEVIAMLQEIGIRRKCTTLRRKMYRRLNPKSWGLATGFTKLRIHGRPFCRNWPSNCLKNLARMNTTRLPWKWSR
jgi:citrate synthase